MFLIHSMLSEENLEILFFFFFCGQLIFRCQWLTHGAFKTQKQATHVLPQTWCGTARLQDLDYTVLLKLQRGRSRETRGPGVGSSACSPELQCLPDTSWLTKERFTRLRFEVSYLTPFLHWFPVLGTAFQSAVKNRTVCHCVCLEGLSGNSE